MIPTSSDIPLAEGPLVPLWWAPPIEAAAREDLAGVFARLARRLASEPAVPLQERIYATAEAVDDVLVHRAAAWRDAGLDPDTPVTVVSNPSCSGATCSGVQILAWRTDGQGRVRSLSGDEGSGRLLDLGRSRALFLADVLPDPSADAPLASMFELASTALGRHAMSFRDVARTWLYVDELLPRYAALNAARDAVFEAHGLRVDDALVDAPASTGIQGRHPTGAPCFLDLIAARDLTGERPFEPVRAALQPEAWDYGSAFSRGMRVRLGGSTLTTISGTASIGDDGSSLHPSDPAAQITETLRNVESLLARCGLPPRAPGLWTLYFKDESTWQAWRAEVEAGRLEPVDGVAIFGDVCREELLFEVEFTSAG